MAKVKKVAGKSARTVGKAGGGAKAAQRVAPVADRGVVGIDELGGTNPAQDAVFEADQRGFDVLVLLPPRAAGEA